MTTFDKKPLAVQFPELNSFQISKLREMLKAEYERGATEAKSALYDLMLGVVGEDIKPITEELDSLGVAHKMDRELTTVHAISQNQLKAEQRNKLKELFDGN